MNNTDGRYAIWQENGPFILRTAYREQREYNISHQ